MERDYNKEQIDKGISKYHYAFDFDVMHPFMIKACSSFFRNGNVLELGSHKGKFTERLLPFFNDITCIEASSDAVEEAKKKVKDWSTHPGPHKDIYVYNDLFENVSLPNKYDNIIMTHVLEHLDNPILVLKRINDEWLSEDGRFFLICPNGNAASRQIAVKMGKIKNNNEVTESEKSHGHTITYTLDTLERDARAGGLKIINRTGIFFKALSNFQWDKLLETDIVSKEYLEGCYELGQQYPDLCSSIMLVCEKC